MCTHTDLNKIRTKKDIICYKVLKNDKGYFRAPYYAHFIYVLGKGYISYLGAEIEKRGKSHFTIHEIKYLHKWLKEYCGFTIWDTLKYIVNAGALHEIRKIKEGLYAFLDQEHARMTMEDFCISRSEQTYSVVKCIIPAGSYIYVNLTTEVIVSESLIVEEIVDSLQYSRYIAYKLCDSKYPW